jgi:hypothetical protein
MKPIDKQIEEIIIKIKEDAVNPEVIGFIEVASDKGSKYLIKELIQKEREEAIYNFVMRIIEKYILQITLNELEDFTIDYLSQTKGGKTE